MNMWLKFAVQNTLRNRRRSLVTATIAALGPVKHRQDAAKADRNLGGVSVVAVLILPLAGLELSLDVDLAALFEEAFHHADKAIILDDNRVPFGALLLFAAGLVLPAFGRSDAKVGDAPAVLE